MSVYFADRIVIPYKPRLIILGAGTNDIHNGKTPEQVCTDFQAFVVKVRAALPNTRIAFLGINPAPSRWAEREKQQAANRLIQNYVASGQNLDYIALWDVELGPGGTPREDLFVADRLHPSAAGYKVRADVVRPHLQMKNKFHKTMARLFLGLAVLGLAAAFSQPLAAEPATPKRHTEVSIVGDDFYINGKPTYQGRIWHGHKIEGLLLNARMVQGIYDDRNPDTVARWAYPDTGQWDAERNTREFIAAMPEWRRHGLLAFTLNLQGGSPYGYSQAQPWQNSAFEADGSLRSDYAARLERILTRADELGMVVIVGYFYFGQDARLRDDPAVTRATDNATRWLLDHHWRNVLVEVDNECDTGYHHALLKPDRVAELILRVQSMRRGGRRLLAGTSYSGGVIPGEAVVRVSDFLLLHGNGVSAPKDIGDMVRRSRAVPGYTPKPILFNEDDHYDFDKSDNNFTTAIGEHASWGCFDYRKSGEDFGAGYQSVPVNWGISSPRKRAFFDLLAGITGQKK